MEFIYDGNGLCGVKCNNENYLYRKNAQGDITHILGNDGMVVAKYIYDAWGNHAILDANGNDLASGVGVLNPFRYRSYYYDEETDLYYLQTRYYDPEVGRFISQDDVSYLAPDNINGLNLYAYCSNNPVMNVDPTGRFVITISMLIGALVVGAITGAVIGGIAGGVTAAINGQDIFIGIAFGALGGVIMGAGSAIGGVFLAPALAGASITLAAGTAISTAAAVAIGTSISFVTGAIGGAIMDIGNQYFNTGTIDWGSVGISALEYGLINVLCAFTGAIIDGLNIAFVGEMVKGIKAIRNVVAVTSATGIIGSLIDVLRNMWNNRLVK